MDEDIDLCQWKLSEMIDDENRIATFKTVSSELNVDIFTAKKLLTSFVDQNKSDNKLLVTYVIGGITDDDSFLIRHVLQSKLEDAEKEFKSVQMKSIFSVQTSQTKFDVELLANVDRDVGKCLGAIGYEEDIKRTDIRPVISEKPKVPLTTNKTSESKTETKPIADVKMETNVPKKSSISSMFAKVEKKAAEIPKEASSKPKKSPPQKNKGIDSFFGKQTASKPAPVETSKKSEEKPKEQVTLQPTVVEKEHTPELKSSTKKRKRVVKIESDSSDDDIFATARSPSPLRKKIADVKLEDMNPTIGVKPSNESNKSIKRTAKKIIKKTFTDAEGFNVTKNVEVSDEENESSINIPVTSDSKQNGVGSKNNVKQPVKPTKGEEEVKEQPKSKSPSKPKKKALPSNQKTLMGFFQKAN